MEALAISGAWDASASHGQYCGLPWLILQWKSLLDPEEFMKLESWPRLGFKPGALRTTGASQLPRRQLRRHICREIADLNQ